MDERYAPPRRAPGHPGLTALAVLLTLALIGFLLARSTVFVLRSVQVEGDVTRYTPQQIADIAGVSMYQSIFSINEGQLRQAVESNRYLRFEGMQIVYPDGLILRVSERQPSATVTYLGVMFVLDDEGRVLDQYSADSETLDVPVVTGLKIKRLAIGEELQTEMQWQTQAVQKVLAVLARSELTGRAVELNAENSDNLYLMTTDGLKIELGDVENMETKISIAQEVLRQIDSPAFLAEVEQREAQAKQEAAQQRARAVANGTMTQEEADEEARLAEQEDGLQFDLMGAKLDVSSAQVADFVPAQ
ncbi:MAG TPA: FtsQ-type POTRA domain-containing protein [Candidatus Onthenecus intestinigallinarum]|uniref:FtsQ-type POTRA domain-containing protein n=1 Tax=Candidatus Onthenecus intestinigallinarum TaxID=2840875 RepID=A0A9D0ZBE1_9FIRM|nr:FtsQ-type POTRA domain-containing protein [Candidatus Onthenecus intestinigallinarum]